jgi:predicted transport protein
VQGQSETFAVDELIEKIKKQSEDPYNILTRYVAYLKKTNNISNLTLKQQIVTIKNFLEYEDKQCEWHVVDQTGMAVVNFEDPAKDGAS